MASTTKKVRNAVFLLISLGLLSPIFFRRWPFHSPVQQQMRQHLDVEGEISMDLNNTTLTNGEPSSQPSQIEMEVEPPTEPSFPVEDAFVVKKTFSPVLRLVYLVGLEGTGHHYIADVLDNFCKTSKAPCPEVCKISHALYPGLGNPSTPVDYRDARRTVRDEMEKLAADASSLPGTDGIMVGFGKCRWESGMMSYPNYNGHHKPLQYVDFKLLAEEAERAGVDLRIIYLNRSARDILISDTVHNKYGETFMFEFRSLLVNADVVKSTFAEIDTGFVTCFRYENISDPQQASRVANFVAPTQYTAGQLSTAMLDAVKVKTKGRRAPESYQAFADPTTGESLLIARLQQKLDLIEKLECGT